MSKLLDRRSRLLAWLMGRRVYVPRYLERIARELFPKEIDSLLRGVCPWCGRRLSSFRARISHLGRGACGERLRLMVATIDSVVERCLEHVWRSRGTRGCTVYIVEVGGRRARFRSMEEAMLFAVREIAGCSAEV